MKVDILKLVDILKYLFKMYLNKLYFPNKSKAFSSYILLFYKVKFIKWIFKCSLISSV